MKVLIVGSGVEADNLTKSASGLYITDVEGIELVQLEKLDNEERNDYIAAFEKIYKRAEMHFIADLEVIILDNCQHIDASTFIGENQSNKAFAGAFMYLLAKEMMAERAKSSRINDYTLLSKDEAKENIRKYEATYKKMLDDFTRVRFKKAKPNSYRYASDLP